ncbi:MAG: Ribonuclease VapC43 [Lentisphaerae bacterium ADurb.BinA184]|nr:MAG: Ribonuclease VapC43 [Lentisphaerae bacterium ADurb.BinA184]
MIAVDTNLLVYAHREDCEFHSRALVALKGLAEGDEPWAVPWPCVHEFLAITTHPRIFLPPSPLGTAVAAVGVWIQAPTCRMLGEGPGYFDLLKALLAKSKASGPMIHDARIVALCLHHGVRELWTADRDFSRFSALRTRNPLVNE